MEKSRVSRIVRRIALGLAICLGIAVGMTEGRGPVLEQQGPVAGIPLSVFEQDKPASSQAGRSERKTSLRTFQVLKGMPASQVMGAMSRSPPSLERIALIVMSRVSSTRTRNRRSRWRARCSRW
jgi:hypothetical protein